MIRARHTCWHATLGLAALLSAGNPACKSSDKPTGPLEYTLSLPASDLSAIANASGAAVIVDGDERGVFTPTGDVRIGVAANETLAGHAIAVRLKAVCGHVDASMTIVGGAEDEQQKRKTAKGAVRLDLKLTGEPLIRSVYFDNLDGPERTVSLGGVDIALREKSGTRAAVPIGTCEQAGTIKIGDRTLGTVPRFGDKQALLIDIDGGHCYTATDVETAVEDVQAEDRLEPAHFSARTLYVTPKVGFALTAPPAAIGGAYSRLTHTQLQRAVCAPDPKPAKRKTRRTKKKRRRRRRRR